MKKLVCCTSLYSIGCTFMDWSIHFLSGQNNYFRAEENNWIKLSMNPVQTINAHGHRKNHPNGLDESKKTIETLLQQNALVSYYPAVKHPYGAASNLGIYSSSLTIKEWQQICDYQENDYNQLLKFSDSQQAKIIYVSIDTSRLNVGVITTQNRSMDQLFFSKIKPNSLEDLRKERDSAFFKDSVDTWNSLGLTNKWDIRERLALYNIKVNQFKIDFSFEHYWLDCQTWWYNGKNEILRIMNWLELPVDSDRLDKWVPIYEAWQQIQFKVMQFNYNYKHIVDCIVNNWSYPIDLSFEQEVIIQSCLIYDHGLNLKTWQLEKFPNNTQDLHRLLEPNIHPLT